MKVFSAHTTIAAPPATIWAILTDAPRYPEWDPDVERIEGAIAAGATLTAYSKLSPGRAFPVKVTQFEPHRRMVWSGGMPLGLFKGERSFNLKSQPDNSVEFSLREEFSGLLLPLFGRGLPDLDAAFARFAAALKLRAEARTA
ncbi:MAG: SRPBCC domain-containing protein [Oscillochloris sp.]|nr:SRPBCC domain-containing protein [Oscillochloris sp.]